MKSRLPGAVCACILVYSGTVHSASFTGLGVSSISKVSPDGSFVFNDTDRWTDTGGWESWESYSGGTLTGGVSAVSHDGSAVAGSLNGNAYRWTASSGMVGLGSLPASYSYSVSGISSDGSVIAGTGKDTTPESDMAQAYRWTAPTGMVGLSILAVPPSNPESYATGISADGAAVLGISPYYNTSGYWAADGSWVGLSGVLDRPTVASTDASVIGGDRMHRWIFRWTASDGVQELEGINSMEVSANGMSADGSIIVGYSLAFGTPNVGAWIWDEVNGRANIYDILVEYGMDLTGWDLLGAASISADGSIITGWGVNPSGQTEAWVSDFSAVPIPPALYLFGSGLLGLIGIARRKAG